MRRGRVLVRERRYRQGRRLARRRQRFIGFAAALGLFAGSVVTAVVVRRPPRRAWRLHARGSEDRAAGRERPAALDAGRRRSRRGVARGRLGNPRMCETGRRAARSIRRRCSPAQRAMRPPASAAGAGSSYRCRAKSGAWPRARRDVRASAASRPKSWRCSPAAARRARRVTCTRRARTRARRRIQRRS